MLPHDFMTRGDDVPITAEERRRARAPTTNVSQIPNAFRLNTAAAMARSLDEMFQRDGPAAASTFGAAAAAAAAATGSARKPAPTGTQDPISAMLAAHGMSGGDFDQEAYDKIKAKMENLKEREEREKALANAPLEDDPGNFATMLDTTLDFFFLTPIMFTRSDGTPMFDPRARDAARMSLITRPRTGPAPGALGGSDDMTPMLLFTPDSVVSPDADGDPGLGPDGMGDAPEQPLPGAGALAATAAAAAEATRALALRQPEPEESRDPGLVGRYRPRIPAGHKHIPASEYTYDQAYRMCPVMIGHRPGDEPTARGTHCLIRLPGIFAPLPVYGLPRLCAQNLIYCVQRLYRMFGCRLPYGVQWRDLALRVEGASAALDPLEDVLPEIDTPTSPAAAAAAFAAAAAAATVVAGGEDDVIDVDTAGGGTSVAVIDMHAAAPTVLILEPRSAAITLFVTNAPQPLALVPAGKAPPRPVASATSAAARAAAAADSRKQRRQRREQQRERQTRKQPQQQSNARASVGDDSSEDDDDDADEVSGLRLRGKQERSSAAAAGGTGDSGDDDDEIDEYYASLAAHAQSAAPPNWRDLIRDYEPRRRPQRVTIDDFSKNFTVTDLKIAAAAMANLELTPQEAAAIPLWRELRAPPADVAVDAAAAADAATAAFVANNGVYVDENEDNDAGDIAAALRSGRNPLSLLRDSASGTGPRRMLPVSALAPSVRDDFRWELVSLPNTARVWELGLDARGLEHNVFELQFDVDTVAAAVARTEARAAAASAGAPGAAPLPQTVMLAGAGATVPDPRAVAKSASTLYQAVRATAAPDDGDGVGSKLRYDSATGQMVSVIDDEEGNNAFSTAAGLAAAVGSAETPRRGVAGALQRVAASAASAASALSGTVLAQAQDERKRTTALAESIRQRQKRRMQEISFEKARDAGLLHPYLDGAKGAGGASAGGKTGLLPGIGGARSGWWGRSDYRNGGGWLSTPMLVFYAVAYVLIVATVWLSSMEHPEDVPLIGSFIRPMMPSATDARLSGKAADRERGRKRQDKKEL